MAAARSGGSAGGSRDGRDEHAAVLTALLDRHGRTFADEAGIGLEDTPAPLHQLLVLASLLSANTAAGIGVRAAAAVTSAFPTAEKLAAASHHARWRVLADARSLRKDQHAHQLGQLADHELDAYGGDLRRLREDAGGDPERVHELVQGFAGIGAVGADIYCREAQAVWPVLRPWADGRMSGAADDLHLPTDADGLARLTGSGDLSLVGAALLRCHLADDADEVLAAARPRGA